jgi:hypothetical protein
MYGVLRNLLRISYNKERNTGPNNNNDDDDDDDEVGRFLIKKSYESDDDGDLLFRFDWTGLI